MARRVKIRRIVDGDSLEAQYVGCYGWLRRRPFTVRLYAIDAPELSQPGGTASRAHLQSLVRRGGLRMELVDTDRYGRRVALLYRGRRGRRRSVNLAMVQDGMAHWYRRYGGRELGFERAEAEARARRRGIWRHRAGAQRPWDYRTEQRNRTDHRRRRRPLRARLVLAMIVLLIILVAALYAAARWETIRQIIPFLG